MEAYQESLVGELAPLAGKKVYLAAATLRPETMYGQTNCWVLPDGDYGAFEMADGSVLVMCDRAARNLAYQEHTAQPGVSVKLLGFNGQALIGCAVKSPLAVLPKIYCLPMLTILMNKGTGVVTSVPSDSPADFMALSDLKAKPPMREKFGVKDEWVMPFEVVPCVRIEEFGDACAPVVCERLKIKSQNDKVKLEEAKHQTYLKGFTDGVMLLGAFKGKPVKEVKTTIRDVMIDAGEAIVYSEPEKQVMSRSGDECVVALTDQWYLEYGEEQWRARAEKCLAGMNTYHDEARRAFESTLGWLRQWACSRSFGLGTRVPWDAEFLIESLSDSTIYMAYYTVAHLLQGGDMYGKTRPSVSPEQMTDEVWDAVFLVKALDAGADFPAELLAEMKAEFEFWYPFDLRVSGKDLIQNHLTFAIYNHAAIWENDESKWPRSFRTNGHLLLNNEKMSKSTGNFKTLKQSIEEYSSDAMRFALADAGDTIEDANFVDDTANAAILRLTKELVWIEEMLAICSSPEARSGSIDVFADRVFSNAMDVAIEATKNNYEKMMFRDALKSGFLRFAERARRVPRHLRRRQTHARGPRDALHRGEHVVVDALLPAHVRAHLGLAPEKRRLRHQSRFPGGQRAERGVGVGGEILGRDVRFRAQGYRQSVRAAQEEGRRRGWCSQGVPRGERVRGGRVHRVARDVPRDFKREVRRGAFVFPAGERDSGRRQEQRARAGGGFQKRDEAGDAVRQVQDDGGADDGRGRAERDAGV